MIQGKYLSTKDDLSEVYEIRKEIFLNELGMKLEEVFDEWDSLSNHAIVYDMNNNKRAVATGRIYFNGKDFQIDMVAVQKSDRRMKYGDFIIRLLVNKAFLAGALQIVVQVQSENTAMVELLNKIGFVKFQGQDAENKYNMMKLETGKLCKQCESNFHL